MRAFGVAGREAAYNGVKATVAYRDASGAAQYPQVSLPEGTFGWTNGTVHVSWLRGLPANGVVTIALGLEKCTGRAEFDLSALSRSSVPLGIERVNGDYIVQYPSCGKGEREAPRPPVLRGFNAAHDLAEADLRGMRAHGATLVRFQLTRSGRNDDLAEYAAWVDSRLDHLVAVLGWAQGLGMKVCVDLHVLPGGTDGSAASAGSPSRSRSRSSGSTMRSGSATTPRPRSPRWNRISKAAGNTR